MPWGAKKIVAPLQLHIHLSYTISQKVVPKIADAVLEGLIFFV